MLNEKKVKIGNVDYVVRELTIGQMMPLMEKLSGDESSKAQLEMVSLAVCVNGEALGDSVDALGFKAYIELSKHVMEVNGMGDSGND